MKKFYLIILLVIVISCLYFVFNNNLTKNNNFISKKEKDSLKALVFNKIENDSKVSVWDKKVDILSIDKSNNAVQGGWFAGDRWFWIAWRSSSKNEWNILLSHDGFDCKELDKVPAKYVSYFGNIIYEPWLPEKDRKSQYELKDRYCV